MPRTRLLEAPGTPGWSTRSRREGEARIADPALRVRDRFAWQPWIASAEGSCASAVDDRFRSLVEQALLVVNCKNPDVAPPELPFEGLAATAHPFGPSRFLTVRADRLLPPLVEEAADLAVLVSSVGLRPPSKPLINAVARDLLGAPP